MSQSHDMPQESDAPAGAESLDPIATWSDDLPAGHVPILIERVEPPKAKMHERVAGGILSVMGEACALILGLAFLWFGAMAALVERGGVDLTTMVPSAEAGFAQAFEGRAAKIGALELRVNAERGDISLVGRDIAVSDKDGALVENLERLRFDLGLDAALTGVVEPRRLFATGGAVSMVRTKSGWAAGLGTPDNIGKLGPTLKLGEPGSGVPDGFEGVSVNNATLFISDRVDGLEARVTEAAVRSTNGEALAATLTGVLEVGESRAPINMSFAPTDAGDRLRVEVKGLNPSDLAAQSGPLARLSALNAPVDGNVVVTRNAAELDEIDFDVDAGRGRLQLASQRLDIADFVARGTVRPSTGDIAFSALSISSGLARASGSGAVRLTRDARGVSGLSGRVAASEVSLNTVDILGRRLVIAAPKGKVAWDRDTHALDFTEMSFGLVGVQFFGDVGVEVADGLSRVKTDLRMEGVMSSEELLSLWPEAFVGGARRWIDRSILSGRIENVSILADLSGGDLHGEPIANENLTVGFGVSDGLVRYISTMTPLEGARGRGLLRGNSLEFDLEAGTVSGLGVTRAKVTMPILKPKGSNFTIDVEGSGDAPTLLRLINEKPFEYADRYGLNPDEFAGQGAVKLTITRPLREFFDPSLISYAVEGTFDGVTIPFSIAGQQLTDGQLTLSADATKLALDGPVSFGPWRAQMSYLDTLGEQVTPTRATLEGILSRDAMDSFGVGLRQYLDGDIPVTIAAISDGLALRSADITADLTEATLNIDPYWAKPAGIPAELTGTLSRVGVVSLFEDVSITAPGMSLSGSVELGESARLRRLRVDQLAIRDIMDVNLTMTPNADRTRLNVVAGGGFLDLSPAVENRLRNPGTSDALPVDLSAQFGTLRLAKGYDVADATVRLIHSGTGVEVAELSGTIGEDAVSARIGADPISSIGGRLLTIDLPDAAGAGQALFGFEGITGGALDLTATLPPAGVEGRVLGEIEMSDVTLTRAPILARILSLASLEGLGGALSGQGLSFEDVEADFAYENGQLSLRKTRANGPALGLTAEGEIALGERLLDLNGVIVPAYRMNSLLGDIPLIGDIFVGKKGEGILSLSYTVGGPFSSAQVAVNPLSAMTPGVFREIFNPQRDKLPEMGEAAPEAAPQAEPQAELEPEP